MLSSLQSSLKVFPGSDFHLSSDGEHPDTPVLSLKSSNLEFLVHYGFIFLWVCPTSKVNSVHAVHCPIMSKHLFTLHHDEHTSMDHTCICGRLSQSSKMHTSNGNSTSTPHAVQRVSVLISTQKKKNCQYDMFQTCNISFCPLICMIQELGEHSLGNA
jgi:hypothetical protein